jgi:glycyl-tRNA synthetase
LDKSHPKFCEVAYDILHLYSAERQSNGEHMVKMSAGDALKSGTISSEMLTYQLCLAGRFLNDLGIPGNVVRFRQHLSSEMAHYAIDCWDVEIETDKYGWVEIIGIADRSDYDLKSHSQYSKEDLKVFIEYSQSKVVKKLVVKPLMSKFGPLFKADATKILEALKDIDASQIANTFKDKGKYELEVEGSTYQLSSDLLELQEVDETLRGVKIYPHVIEPSYGIDRIFYAVLLHCYCKEDDKVLLRLPADIAPVEVNVFPLLNKDDQSRIALEIRDQLRNDNIVAEYDSSGTIGRRYARSDEIGVPFAVTVDHDTLNDNKVTIRNRDDSKQIRIPISDVYQVIKDLSNLKISFKDLENEILQS